jgi:hypothetical protein
LGCSWVFSVDPSPWGWPPGSWQHSYPLRSDILLWAILHICHGGNSWCIVSCVVYTLCINIRNTFPVLSCPQQVSSVPQGCCSILTLMLPTVVSSRLDVLWVVDHSWYTQETVECEKPSSVAVLDTLKMVCLAPTTIPLFKGA